MQSYKRNGRMKMVRNGCIKVWILPKHARDLITDKMTVAADSYPRQLHDIISLHLMVSYIRIGASEIRLRLSGKKRILAFFLTEFREKHSNVLILGNTTKIF